MSFSSLRIRASRASFGFRSLAIAMLLWPAGVLAAPLPPTAIAVNVDQAKLVKLPAKVATIVVGNPLIADVTLQTGGIIVVTGKGYGATNFIAMDRGGEILVDRMIQVEGPTDQLVTDLSRRRARSPTAACRSASGGSRSATATTTSSRRSTRPARSPARRPAAPRGQDQLTAAGQVRQKPGWRHLPRRRDVPHRRKRSARLRSFLRWQPLDPGAERSGVSPANRRSSPGVPKRLTAVNGTGRSAAIGRNTSTISFR